MALQKKFQIFLHLQAAAAAQGSAGLLNSDSHLALGCVGAGDSIACLRLGCLQLCRQVRLHAQKMMQLSQLRHSD